MSATSMDLNTGDLVHIGHSKVKQLKSGVPQSSVWDPVPGTGTDPDPGNP
jgi:hypothetical protein